MLAGCELAGKELSELTITEFVLGELPPLINRFRFGKETSPKIRSSTPELSMSIARTVEPECFGIVSVGFVNEPVPSGNSGLVTFPVVHGKV